MKQFKKSSKAMGDWVRAYWEHKVDLAEAKEVNKYEIDYGNIAFWIVITVVLIKNLT